ncbi:MAG: tyrosine--tRNA ligase [Candidatus Moraniibacteriota bacterium]|nr:MAG: tyrosine--tRNA ligase [Candidatus Moranbacteria bacterium]
MKQKISDEKIKMIDAILDRGVLTEFLPTKEAFRKRLLSGEKMRFYIGMDPTAKALHLGHAQNLMVLEDFRKLGHEVIFLIGDFTGIIGDPSDKSATRTKQTREEIEKNFKDWKEQVKNIADFNDTENPFLIKYNSAWLSKLNFEEVLELSSNFTVQQMLERDMFEKRMKQGKPIYVHEFMYPLMQGYDSVAMDVDVELCGTDQIFNALAGRTLLQKLKGKDKFVIATKLIADEKTNMLMSKSNGTGVFLDLSANDLFGAIMSQPDGMIRPLFLGCTRLSLEEIDKFMTLENPRDAKVALAHEIVRIYHGKESAVTAEKHFVDTFSKREIPENVDECTIESDGNILNYLVKSGGATSKSDARRKIEQGGVSIDGKKVVDIQYTVSKTDINKVMRVGKKFFVKITK